MSDLQQPSGKALVRSVFISRLEEAGFRRRRGTSVDQHEAAKKNTCELLAYMTAENLAVLAEELIEAATSDAWPTELVLRQWANGLQEKPPEDKPIFRSWLASVRGPEAVADGTLVELYRWLRRPRRWGPPLAMDRKGIRERSDANQHRLQVISERGGPLSEIDRDWLAEFRRDEQAALAIVAQGNRKREGQA